MLYTELMIDVVNSIFYNFFAKLTAYLPNFFGGALIFLIGIISSLILRKVLLSLFSFFKLRVILAKTRVMNQSEVRIWEEVFAEILRWTVIILFLAPSLEVIGLSRATVVLNQLILYLPNVIVAVIIGFVGLIASNLISDLVLHSSKSVGTTMSKSLSYLSKVSVIFFTILIVMNQLGVAQDLVRILFTGIVAMLALAGGLAFGLGGKDLARDILESLRQKLK